VKAPLTWPKSVDSSNSEGMAPVLMGTNGLSRRRRVGVDALAMTLFAGAALTLDQNCRTAGRDLGDEVEDLEHNFAFADDVGKAVRCLRCA